MRPFHTPAKAGTTNMPRNLPTSPMLLICPIAPIPPNRNLVHKRKYLSILPFQSRIGWNSMRLPVDTDG